LEEQKTGFLCRKKEEPTWVSYDITHENNGKEGGGREKSINGESGGL